MKLKCVNVISDYSKVFPKGQTFSAGEMKNGFCDVECLRPKRDGKDNGLSLLEEKYLQALEIALPILEQQEREEGGWIEWSGGECPVTPGKRVDLKLRGGSITTDYPAGSAQWDHRSEDDDTDIIEYRISAGGDE